MLGGNENGSVSGCIDEPTVGRDHFRIRVVDPDTNVGSEVAELVRAIDREASATGVTLTHQPSGRAGGPHRGGVAADLELYRQLSALRERVAPSESRNEDHPSAHADKCLRGGAAEHHELCRQLSALRERAARAESPNQDVRALRSELATLLFFARTLRADAEAWRAVREDALAELERQTIAARQRRERWLAENQDLVRRRAALQLSIDETAEGLARAKRGECRRTLPVVTLAETLTVFSVTVSSPWSRLRPPRLWLVTLNESCDEVLVRRC